MHFIDFKIFAILSSFLFLGLSFFIKRKVGTYIFPASLMSLAWFFYTFFPLVFLYRVPIQTLPILYLFLCILVFSLGALPFNWSKAFEANNLKPKVESEKLNSHFIRSLFFISVIGGIFFTTMVMINSGFSFAAMLENPRQVSNQFALMRVEGKIHYDFYGILSIFFTYLSPLIGGLAFYQYPNTRKKVMYALLAFMPPVYFMIIQSAKLVVFYSIGFYLSAFLLRKIQNNHLDLFDKKIIKQVLISFLILIPFLIFAFSTRNFHSRIDDIVQAALHSVQSYAFGQTYAFADFFTYYLSSDTTGKYQHDLNSYGSYTFTSIYNLFGAPKIFPVGTYYDYYTYKDLLATNIYTIFRGLINDFGAIGTLAFMLVSGYVAHAFYYWMLLKKSHIASAVFIITAVYIEGTYLASIFMARYMYLILVVIILIFWLNDIYYKKIMKE